VEFFMRTANETMVRSVYFLPSRGARFLAMSARSGGACNAASVDRMVEGRSPALICIKGERSPCGHRGAIECRFERSCHKRRTMKLMSTLAAVAVATLAGCSSFPVSGTKQPEQHEAHHPAAETAPKVDPARFEQQMKTMREMHQKMVAARTPAERTSLMKDHMKAMQDGMAMMGQKGGGMPMHCGDMPSKPGGPSVQKDMMQRMDMMEMMMQMMVDREAAIPPAAR
jgi:hypothetical protein